MRDDWVETTLGEIAEVIGGGTPRTSVSQYWNGEILWITPTEVVAQDGRVITRTDRTISVDGLRNSGARLLPPGAVLLTSRATIGAVAIAGVPLATNQGFASLVCGPSVLPLYLMLWCQLNREEFVARGAGNTFKEVSKTNVRSIPLLLPPLAEQQRIVAMVEAIDASLLCGRRAERAAMQALVALLENWLAVNAGAATRPLGELADMGSGPSWKASDERDEPLVGAMPVLGITNTPMGVELDLSTIGYVVGLPPGTRILTESSLLMIRTNGNRARIGNVYRVVSEAARMAYSAFQIGIFPRDPVDRDAIYWQLRAPSVQGSISAAASGTTGLGNIAISWLKRLELPWPDAYERARLAETAEALHAVRVSARREIERLEELRRGALADLLSGEHEIPESYDALLEGAAVA